MECYNTKFEENGKTRNTTTITKPKKCKKSRSYCNEECYAQKEKNAITTFYPIIIRERRCEIHEINLKGTINNFNVVCLFDVGLLKTI